jgi:hypothetical protein
MSEYVFEGEIIKLAAKDFCKWQDMYKFINLVEELQQLDMELDAKRMEGGNVKKWFSECIARLNGRNKRAERFNRGSNQQQQLNNNSTDWVHGIDPRVFERARAGGNADKQGSSGTQGGLPGVASVNSNQGGLRLDAPAVANRISGKWDH